MRAVALAVALGASVACLAGGAIATPDPTLCTMNTVRGVVPAQFPLSACVDGSTIWIRDNLDAPVTLKTSGSAEQPTAIDVNQTIAAVLTRRHVHHNPLVLMPGDSVKIPIGTQAATVAVAGLDAAGFYAIAQTITDFIPAGATVQIYDAFTSLIVELDSDFHQYSSCVTGAGRLKKVSCRLLLIRNVTFAVGRAAIAGGGKALLSAVLSEVSFARWFSAQVKTTSTVALSRQRVLNQATAEPQVVFDGSSGTNGPPSQLGPYAMTPFSPDSQDTDTTVDGVAGPIGQVGFSPAPNHWIAGDSWNTWSNGYTGDVYGFNGDDPETSLTITLPAGTHAFYLYAEPNDYDNYTLQATAQDGTTSGPIGVEGESGATYFGFYELNGAALSSITVTGPSNGDGFAVGEFGIG